MSGRWMGVTSCIAMTMVLALTAGCRVQVDKDHEGGDKNVKIETPLGGLRVRSGDVSAANLGLPVYPGAELQNNQDNHKPVDMRMGFGDWQMHIKIVPYHTADAAEKVADFYQKALGRYGNVIRCKGKEPEGTPTVTSEGLTCQDDVGKHGSMEHVNASGDLLTLKAGSRHHQHLLSIDKTDSSGTDFALVELELPADVN